MDNMNKFRRGFTLIEITLFLAVTGLLFLSVTIGVQNSIYQQRYSDAVQSFADFLGDIYSQVLNVQHEGNGRTEQAVYGKMLTFGEKVGDDSSSEQIVHVYDILGLAVSYESISNGGATMDLLRKVKADVVERGSDGAYRTVGVSQAFTPKWGSRIQKVNGFGDYEGTIMVVRNPSSGTIQTFVKDDVINVEALITGASGDGFQILDDAAVSNFQLKEVDFCVNPDGNNEVNNRTDVRLMKNASNSSGVVIMPRDDESNKCNVVD